VQRFFHRRMTQREPLLHEVNAQRGLHGKRRPSLLAFGRVRRHQLDQRIPRHHSLHLRQELMLARALGRQIQSQIGWLHALNRRNSSTARQADLPGVCADLS
jgi:hypothetical protein